MTLNKKILSLGLMTLIACCCVMVIAMAQTTPSISDVLKQQVSQPVYKVFENKNNHYSIKYPSDWSYHDARVGTVVFNGKLGTAGQYFSVNIQSVLTKKMGGEYDTVKEIMDDINRQAVTRSHVKLIASGPYGLSQPDGSTLQGQYVVLTYGYDGIILKQWQIVVLGQHGSTFQAWAYTAPVEQYDRGLPIAKAMLASWSIQ